MVMQEAGEMYLETILRIQEEQGYTRSIDVANRFLYHPCHPLGRFAMAPTHGHQEMEKRPSLPMDGLCHPCDYHGFTYLWILWNWLFLPAF